MKNKKRSYPFFYIYVCVYINFILKMEQRQQPTKGNKYSCPIREKTKTKAAQ